MSPFTLRSLSLIVILAVPATAFCSPPPAAAPEPAGQEAPAAVVGDRVITMAELRDAASSRLAQIRQQEYDILREVLDAMINDALVEQEAASRGVEVRAMLDDEITAKVPEVSDEQVDAFYEQNKSQINQPKEQVVGQIRSYLARNYQGNLFQEFISGLRSRAGVTISLEPPRFDVPTDGDPSSGPEDAPVTIVEFSDFQCPFCSRVLPTLKAIRERYGEKVRLVFRDFPLDFHKEAQKAAEAAQCAADQDKFWPYHDLLFANQRSLGVPSLKAHATTLALDADAFAQCLDSGKYADEVKADQAEGAQYGVTGTPAFFINGRFLNGAQPLEQFTAVIDEELAALGLSGAPAGGTEGGTD